MKTIDKNVANALRLLGIATPYADWESVEYESFSTRYRIRVKDRKGAEQEIIYDANWERILQIRFDLESSLPSTEELKNKHYEKKKVSQAQR